MSMWLLDASTVAALMAHRSDRLLQWVESMDPGSLAISALIAHELYFSAYLSQKIVFNLKTLRLFFGDLAVLDFDREDARVAAEIRAELTRQNITVSLYDALIAGQAKARNFIFVTTRRAVFASVSGLRIEDWSAAT